MGRWKLGDAATSLLIMIGAVLPVTPLVFQTWNQPEEERLEQVEEETLRTDPVTINACVVRDEQFDYTDGHITGLMRYADSILSRYGNVTINETERVHYTGNNNALVFEKRAKNPHMDCTKPHDVAIFMTGANNLLSVKAGSNTGNPIGGSAYDTERLVVLLGHLRSYDAEQDHGNALVHELAHVLGYRNGSTSHNEDPADIMYRYSGDVKEYSSLVFLKWKQKQKMFAGPPAQADSIF